MQEANRIDSGIIIACFQLSIVIIVTYQYYVATWENCVHSSEHFEHQVIDHAFSNFKLTCNL